MFLKRKLTRYSGGAGRIGSGFRDIPVGAFGPRRRDSIEAVPGVVERGSGAGNTGVTPVLREKKVVYETLLNNELIDWIQHFLDF
jgi:hypothetical protein